MVTFLSSGERPDYGSRRDSSASLFSFLTSLSKVERQKHKNGEGVLSVFILQTIYLLFY